MKLGWVVAIYAASACSGTATDHAPAPTPSVTAAPSPVAGADKPTGKPRAPVGCDATIPAAACKLRDGLHACAEKATDRVGEWRYALITGLFDPTENITADLLGKAWTAGKIAATSETAAALAPTLGKTEPPALAEHPTLDAQHWAIVPADALVPAWKVITIDGVHPLGKSGGALALPLCGPGNAKDRVANIDPTHVTTVAMTGTTALTRFTAVLMQQKGVLYPAKDVEPWFADNDFVHISNEVSFVPKCDTGDGKATMEFCSRENYIELLEKVHTNIVELTGSHLADYGRSWIDHTLEVYKKRNWMWFGGGHDQLDATAVRVIEHRGNKLAFLGCNKVRTTNHVITNGPDTAVCDLDRMVWQVHDLRRRGLVPIVSIQHEEVYYHEPPDVLVVDFRRLAEAGAAFVMGSQAHCAHPWEIHYGAFIHYGPGNLFFDQQVPLLQDATEDRLYFHDNKLLTVGHLYTRIEEQGRPRPMNDKERAGFLRVLVDASKPLRRNDPWGTPQIPSETRDRPDSFLVGKRSQPITVWMPASYDAAKRYPLVIDVDGKATHPDDAFVVTTRDRKVDRELAALIAKFMLSKYPVDEARITPPLPAPKSPSTVAKSKKR